MRCSALRAKDPRRYARRRIFRKAREQNEKPLPRRARRGNGKVKLARDGVRNSRYGQRAAPSRAVPESAFRGIYKEKRGGEGSVLKMPYGLSVIPRGGFEKLRRNKLFGREIKKLRVAVSATRSHKFGLLV